MLYPPFHNTTSMRGRRLREALEQATTHRERIRTWFEWHPDEAFTVSELWQRLFDRSVPKHSIGPRVTELKEMGVLVKCDEQQEGVYGRPEHLWRLATTDDRDPQQTLFD